MLATSATVGREIFARMRPASLLLACALGLAPAFVLAAKVPAEIRIATWNLEWFMKPETLRALAPACAPRDAPRDGARRGIPCDVAHAQARSQEDISALSRYARALDADVVALQEVDGADAARLVFPNHEFCFSGRVAVQNNGFAIRRGIPFACGADVVDLALADDVRRGVDLRLFPGTPAEIALLSVHLKSGCARDPLDSTRASCRELRRQLPFLEAWIDARAAEQKPFAVLGDFNRDLRQEPAGVSFWKDIDDADPPAADLVNTAEGQKFQNCSPAQTFSGYIDYIILGRDLARGLVEGSFGRALYRPRDAARRKLSDHCPVFIRLRVADAVRKSS
jgi:endonuclease/exonuclease/phosphatase family metal-dependent hydrolase